MFKSLTFIACALGAVIVFSGCPQSPESASSMGNPYPSLEKGLAAQPTADGGFVVMGSVVRPPEGNGEERLFLSKRRADGTREWSRDFTQSRPFRGMLGMVGNAVKETPGGGFVVGGVLEQRVVELYVKDSFSDEAPYRGFLLRVDESGNEVWRQTYGDSKTVTGWVNDVTPTVDGGFVMAYSEYRNDAGRQFWIQKADSSGNPTWRTPTPTNGEGQKVLALDDGSCLIAGPGSYAEADGKAFLMKTDADGNPVWSRFYTSLGAVRYLPRMSLRQSSDGSLLLAGATVDEGGFWILKTDADGNETARFVTLVPLPYSLHTIVATDDGGCILGAEDEHYDGPTVFAIKIDSEGTVQWTTQLNSSKPFLSWTTCVQPWGQNAYVAIATTTAAVDASLPLPWAGRHDLNIAAFSLTGVGELVPWPSE